MAKIPASRLKLKKDIAFSTIKWQDVAIDVTHYLPIEEKINVVQNVINNSLDDNDFYNPMKIHLFLTLEIMYSYTNISFTEKMKENPLKLYDSIVHSGLLDRVLEKIPEDEIVLLKNSIDETIKSIYTYKNSVMGILDRVSTDYNNLNLDASEIQKKLADPENMELLKAVLTKLG